VCSAIEAVEYLEALGYKGLRLGGEDLYFMKRDELHVELLPAAGTLLSDAEQAGGVGAQSSRPDRTRSQAPKPIRSTVCGEAGRL
jgi:hypothetical protein